MALSRTRTFMKFRSHNVDKKKIFLNLSQYEKFYKMSLKRERR